MAADGESGTLFTTNDKFILADQFTDIFEANRCLKNRHTMFFCHSINQMGGGDRAGNASSQLANPDQIIKQQGDDVIRLDIGAVGIKNAKTVSISIGGNPQPDGRIVFHQRDKVRNVFLGWLWRMSAKIRVGFVVNNRVGDAVSSQWSVQIAATGAVQGIDP